MKLDKITVDSTDFEYIDSIFNSDLNCTGIKLKHKSLILSNDYLDRSEFNFFNSKLLEEKNNI